MCGNPVIGKFKLIMLCFLFLWSLMKPIFFFYFLLFIDIDELRGHTLFNGYNASSPVVKNLFKALHSFNQEERQMFLRFVWGR